MADLLDEMADALVRSNTIIDAFRDRFYKADVQGFNMPQDSGYQAEVNRGLVSRYRTETRQRRISEMMHRLDHLSNLVSLDPQTVAVMRDASKLLEEMLP